MGKSLVIVESPAKARTITRFLGKGVTVKASMGHVRDLPKSTLGVDEEQDFQPRYEIIPGKKKVIAELKKAAGAADEIYLAADPDREGEAICWHLAEALAKEAKGKPLHRILLHEITRRAVEEALGHPGAIDRDKVEAQQARRVLDRLVGYKISPLLWDKVRRGLSAGRVQSVALRMICDREREIRAFVPEEYWNLDAFLAAAEPPPFLARLVKKEGRKLAVRTGEEAAAIRAEVEGLPFRVARVQSRRRRRHAPPPFITSQLQQEMNRRFNFPVRKTMQLAQALYEGKEVGSEGSVGLITYMRTDSVRVSEGALAEVRELIGDRFGGDYLPEQANRFRSRKSAQEAHEAIRPTAVARDPESLQGFLSTDEMKLYRSIWSRFVASQMTPAEYKHETTVEIEAGPYGFRAAGSILRFDGFLRVFGGKTPEGAGFAEGGLNGFAPNGEGKGEKAGGAGAGEGMSAAGEGGPEGGTGGGAPGAPAGDGREGGTGEESGATAEGAEAGPSVDLPPLEEGQILDLRELRAEQKFTQPPPRYTEATLVKALEENGIGRPSTYATIISVIQNREYVTKEKGKFIPGELGLLVSDLLVESFEELMDVQYTARLEEQLDAVEEGRLGWVELLREFHGHFRLSLEKARTEMRNVKREALPTGEICEKCGGEMVLRWGRYGRFLACGNYPTCRNTREVAGSGENGNGAETSGEPENGGTAAAQAAAGAGGAAPAVEAAPCEACGKPMILKRGRFGPFLACSGYPECRTTRRLPREGGGDSKTPRAAPIPLAEKCPSCGKPLVRREGRFGPFVSCSGYPKCRFIQHEETGVACPREGCGGKIVEKRSKRGKLFYGCDRYPDCDTVMWKKPVPEACPSCNHPYLVQAFKGRGKTRHPILTCPAEGCGYTREDTAKG